MTGRGDPGPPFFSAYPHRRRATPTLNVSPSTLPRLLAACNSPANNEMPLPPECDGDATRLGENMVQTA
jgi:hypothetical protein